MSANTDGNKRSEIQELHACIARWQGLHDTAPHFSDDPELSRAEFASALKHLRNYRDALSTEERANPWRDAVDDALVSSGLDCLGPTAEPKTALARLVEWEVQMALDPAVSARAQALIDKGREERAEAGWVQGFMRFMRDNEKTDEEIGSTLVAIGYAIKPEPTEAALHTAGASSPLGEEVLQAPAGEAQQRFFPASDKQLRDALVEWYQNSDGITVCIPSELVNALAERLAAPVAPAGFTPAGGEAWRDAALGFERRAMRVEAALRAARIELADATRSGFVTRALNILTAEAPPAPAAGVAKPSFHGFMDEAQCRVDLCFTPDTPRADGTYATAYYTRPAPGGVDAVWVAQAIQLIHDAQPIHDIEKLCAHLSTANTGEAK